MSTIHRYVNKYHLVHNKEPISLQFLQSGRKAARVAFNTMRRQVLTLAFAQAIFQTVSVLVVTVGALANKSPAVRSGLRSPSPACSSGLPSGHFPRIPLDVAVSEDETASSWAPSWGPSAASWALWGFGLKDVVGFVDRHVSCGRLSVLCAVLSVFAASEVADTVFRPRAISLVLGGGIVAAFLGPHLAQLGGPLLNPAFTGSFLIAALVSSIGPLRYSPCACEAQESDIDQVESSSLARHRSATHLSGSAIRRGHKVQLAGILGMTATPIAMSHHHHELSATATVIQLHVLGMFLPSFSPAH